MVGDRGYLVLSTFTGDIIFMSTVSGTTNAVAGLGFTGPINTLVLDCTHNLVYVAEQDTNRVLSFPIHSAAANNTNLTRVVLDVGVSRGLTSMVMEHPNMYVADSVGQNVKVVTLCEGVTGTCNKETDKTPHIRYGVTCHVGSLTTSRSQATPTSTHSETMEDDTNSVGDDLTQSKDKMSQSKTEVAVS